MGYLDDETLEEAHGWNSDRPGITEVLAAGKMAEMGPGIFVGPTGAYMPAELELATVTDASDHVTQGWFKDHGTHWTGPYLDPTPATGCIYMRQFVIAQRAYGDMKDIIGRLELLSRPTLADLRGGMREMFNTLDLVNVRETAIEILRDEVLHKQEWGVPDRDEQQAIRDREGLACCLQAVALFDHRIMQRAEGKASTMIYTNKYVSLQKYPVEQVERLFRMVTAEHALAIIVAGGMRRKP